MATRYSTSIEDHSSLLVLWKTDDTASHIDSLWVKVDQVREAVWKYLASNPSIKYHRILSKFPEASEYFNEKDTLYLRPYDPNPSSGNNGLWGGLWPAKLPSVVMTAISSSYEDYSKEITTLRRQIKNNYSTSIPCILVFGHGNDDRLEPGEYRVTQSVEDVQACGTLSFERQLAEIFEHVAADVVKFVTSRVRALASPDFDDVKLPSGDIVIDKKDRQLVARHTAVRAAKLRADRLLSIGSLNGAAQQFAAIEQGLQSASGSNPLATFSGSGKNPPPGTSTHDSLFVRNESFVGNPVAAPTAQNAATDPLQPVWCGGLLESLAGLRYAQTRAFLDGDNVETIRKFFRNFLAEAYNENISTLSEAQKAYLANLDVDAATTVRGLHSIRATKTKIMTQLVTLKFSNEFDTKLEASINDFKRHISETLTAEKLEDKFLDLSESFEVMLDNLVMEVIGLLRGARGFYASARLTLPTVAELEIECLFKRARMYARFGMQQQCREAISKLSERRAGGSSLDRPENFRAYLPDLWRLCGFHRLAFREELDLFQQSASRDITPWLKSRVEALMNSATLTSPPNTSPGVLPLPRRIAGCLMQEVNTAAVTTTVTWPSANRLRIASTLMRIFPWLVDNSLLAALRVNTDNAILITPPQVVLYLSPVPLPPNVRPFDELIKKGVFITGGPAPFYYWDGKFVESRVVWCSDVICTVTVTVRNPLEIPIQLRQIVPYVVDAATGLEVLDLVAYTDDQVTELPVQADPNIVTTLSLRLRPVKSCNVLRVLGFKALWNGQMFYFTSPKFVDVPVLHNFPNIDISLSDDVKEVPVFTDSDRSVLIRLQNRGIIDADQVRVSTHALKCTSDSCPGCTQRRSTSKDGVEEPEVTCTIESGLTASSSINVNNPSMASKRPVSPLKFSLMRGAKRAVRLNCNAPAFAADAIPRSTTINVRIQYGREFKAPDISGLIEIAQKNRIDSIRSIYTPIPVRTHTLTLVAKPTVGVSSCGESVRGGRLLEIKVMNSNDQYSAVFDSVTIDRKLTIDLAPGSTRELGPRSEGTLFVPLASISATSESLVIPWSLSGLPQGTGTVVVSVAKVMETQRLSSNFKEKVCISLRGDSQSGEWKWESAPVDGVATQEIPFLPLYQGVPVTLSTRLNGFGAEPTAISVVCRFIDGDSFVSGHVKSTIGQRGDAEYEIPLELLFLAPGIHGFEVVLRETGTQQGRVVTFAIPLTSNESSTIDRAPTTTEFAT